MPLYDTCTGLYESKDFSKAFIGRSGWGWDSSAERRRAVSRRRITTLEYNRRAVAVEQKGVNVDSIVEVNNNGSEAIYRLGKATGIDTYEWSVASKYSDVVMVSDASDSTCVVKLNTVGESKSDFFWVMCECNGILLVRDRFRFVPANCCDDSIGGTFGYDFKMDGFWGKDCIMFAEEVK